MNSKFFRDLWFKLFKSGSPVMLYIGINGLLFLVGAIVGVFIFFGGEQNELDGIIRSYLAFPAKVDMLPTRFYTLITHAFFHQDLFHILFNLLWLYWMGNLFLGFLKPRQFHVVYWGGVVLGALSFLLLYNLSPKLNATGATLIGASAAVMAIFTAITTLAPNYSLRLLLFGDVKLKYVLLVYILLDIVGVSRGVANIGGNFAHLGGALFGFAYIKLLQSGTDLSSLFKKKPKLRVVKNDTPKPRTTVVNQDEIDAILDKISLSGYEKLTTKEKQTLFEASKN